MVGDEDASFNLLFLIGCRKEAIPTKPRALSFVNKLMHI